MISCPVSVTTISSSIRAALHPSVEGQNVSSANTMPGLISQGWSNDTSRLITGFFVGEAEFLRLGPHGRDLGGGAAGADQLNRGIQIFAAALIRVVHRVRSVADREAAVIAGAISHVRVKDIVVDGIAGAQHTVGKYVRVRVAALA